MSDFICRQCNLGFPTLEAYDYHMRNRHDTFVTNTPRVGDLNDPRRLLEEREKTHGDFVLNTYYSQEIKSIFREAEYRRMPTVYRECLDMIALKISRILSGQANFKDHWDDIAGYATLAAKACTEKD